jgi:hypothetical protein
MLGHKIAFIQPLNNKFVFSQIGMRFSIGTETPALPLMKHELNKKYFCRRIIRERFAEGSQKVGKRRVCQDPTLAQNGLVCLAMVPLQKPFIFFNLCFCCRAICKTTSANASMSSLELKAMFPTQSSCKPSVRNMHTTT